MQVWTLLPVAMHMTISPVVGPESGCGGGGVGFGGRADLGGAMGLPCAAIAPALEVISMATTIARTYEYFIVPHFLPRLSIGDHELRRARKEDIARLARLATLRFSLTER